jgi:hypothetical protein
LAGIFGGLVAVLSASAQTIPYAITEPGFWSRHYHIPHYRELHVVELRVADIVAAGARLIGLIQAAGGVGQLPQPFSYTHGVATNYAADCEIPVGGAAGLFAGLQEMGYLLSYGLERTDDGSAKTGNAQLHYKYRSLKGEIEKLRESAARMPGITGLLQGPLEDLHRMAKADKRARARAYFAVTLVVDERQRLGFPRRPSLSGQFSDWGRIPALRASGYWFMFIKTGASSDYWARNPIDPCWGEPPRTQIILDVPDGAKAQSEIEKVFAAHGGQVHPTVCAGAAFEPTYQGIGLLSFHAADSARAMIVKELTQLGRVVRARDVDAGAPNKYGAVIAAKSRVLRQELAQEAEALKSCPHIRSLVNEELERMSHVAKRFGESRGQVAFTVALVRETGK